MRIVAKVILGGVAVWVALIFIKFPYEHDVAGTQRIEFSSSRKNPKGGDPERRTAVISDSDEILRVCAMLPRLRRLIFDINAHENPEDQERYVLEFVRESGTTRIHFSEREWDPSGRTPQPILEWARKTANESPVPPWPAAITGGPDPRIAPASGVPRR